MSAVSATDAWAAGYYLNGSNVWVPLVLHCNGKTCKQVTSPAPGGARNTQPFGVSAVSSTDAWATGWYINSSGVTVPLILHCNGTTCKQAKSPLPSGAGTGSLSGMSADSASDAWAVGDYDANAAYKTLALHWNGKTWTPVKSPNGA